MTKFYTPQTKGLVRYILLTKAYIPQRKGLVRCHVSKLLMTGLVQVTDALKIRAKAH